MGVPRRAARLDACVAAGWFAIVIGRGPAAQRRILQVIHQFPPYSSQGSEVYCHALAQALATGGDDVRVFHVANADRWRRRLVRTSHDGLPIYHCLDGAEFARVADWPNPFLRRSFRGVLDEFAPEVVHFHNYVSLGDDLVGAARASGAAVVYTLHDFGLICPNTILLRTDGRLCEKATPDFFDHCCPELIRTAHGRAPVVARHLPSLARWRRFAAQQPPGAARLGLSAALRVAEAWLGNPLRTDVDRKRAFFFRQTRRIFQDAHLFLAPSRFLRQQYLSCGLAAEKVAYSRYGLRPFRRLERRSTGDNLQVGYIGALHAHKGVELLIEAFRGIGAGAHLHIHGSTFGSPISASYTRRIAGAGEPTLTLHGAYENRDIAAILASLDVVVVASLWYENSPLTIQEAFIGGVPVVTADRGGMAELVRDGVDGLHFRLGDAADLRARLQYLIGHREVLDRFRRNIPAVPTIDEQAAEVRSHYEAVLASLRHPGSA